MSTLIDVAKGEATAIVIFTGLGVLCYNDQLKRAENLFFQERNHKLTLEIYKPLQPVENNEFLGGSLQSDDPPLKKIDGYGYRRLAVYKDLAQSQRDQNFNPVNLSINVFGAGHEQTDCTFYGDPGFNRLTSTDLNDFGWMINVTRDQLIQNDVGGCSPLRIGYANTRLFISNAQFYTEKIAQYNDVDMIFEKVPVNSAGPNVTEKTSFGKVADEVGATINADVATLEIAVGSEIITHALPRIHKPYVIYINNMSPDPTSDMSLYNSLWVTGETTFELLTQDEVTAIENPIEVTGRELCVGIYTECPTTIGDFLG